MTYTDWIQAISSVVLVAVTWKYVNYTKQLVAETSTVFLNVINVTHPRTMGCKINIKNYGPGHAIRINVFADMIGEHGIEKIKAMGPNILPNNNCADYEIPEDYGFAVESNIYIDYESQTGKNYADRWVYTVQGEGPKIKLAD